MAAQNFKEEDWGNGDTKLGQNWHKNFQAWLETRGLQTRSDKKEKKIAF